MGHLTSPLGASVSLPPGCRCLLGGVQGSGWLCTKRAWGGWHPVHYLPVYPVLVQGCQDPSWGIWLRSGLARVRPARQEPCPAWGSGFPASPEVWGRARRGPRGSGVLVLCCKPVPPQGGVGRAPHTSLLQMNGPPVLWVGKLRHGGAGSHEGRLGLTAWLFPPRALRAERRGSQRGVVPADSKMSYFGEHFWVRATLSGGAAEVWGAVYPSMHCWR